MRATWSKNGLTKCKLFAKNISDTNTAGSIKLPDRRTKHLNRVPKQRRIISVNQDMPTSQLFLKWLWHFGFEVVIQLRFCKLIRNAQHLIYDIVGSRDPITVHAAILTRVSNMIPQYRRICLNQPQIIQGGFNQLVNILLWQLKSIQQLIMYLHHTAIEKMCRLLMLYYTKITVFFQHLKPLLQRPKFDILNTAGSGDNLDVADILSQCKSWQLGNISNSMIGEELLDVRIEAGRFEKSVP